MLGVTRETGVPDERFCGNEGQALLASNGKDIEGYETGKIQSVYAQKGSVYNRFSGRGGEGSVSRQSGLFGMV